MKEDIRQILEAAIRAPSGENAQPWQFTVCEKGGTAEIEVRIAAERDKSPYNWGNRASCFAIGAALENMRITSAGAGLALSFSLLPDPQEPLLAARVSCARAGKRAPHILAEAVFERTTNRKPYRADPLSAKDRDALLNAAAESGQGAVRITSDPAEMRTLANVGAANELIMLNNEVLHDFFFSHVNWTPAEDRERKAGFFIDTLELPPPARMGFAAVKKWSRARFLNKFLHFNAVASKQNAAVYAQCGAMGAIVAPKESAADAIRSGMLLERVWLEATHRGLSMQPMAGLVFLYLGVRAKENGALSPAEREIIEARYADAKRVFSLENETLYFLFRIGASEPPSARALRFPLEDVVTVQKQQ